MERLKKQLEDDLELAYAQLGSAVDNGYDTYPYNLLIIHIKNYLTILKLGDVER